MSAVQSRGHKFALPHLELALDADPANSHIRGLYAQSLMNTRQEEEAFAIIEGIEDSTVASFQYWVCYGNILYIKAQKGDQTTWLPKAMDCFKKAESIRGGRPHIYRSMAQIAIAMKNPDEASKYYEVGAELLIAEGEIQRAKLLLAEGISAISEDETLQTMLEELMKTQ